MFQELEEIQEIYFHDKGILQVGYEISRQQRMVLRMKQGIIVGAYNCAFNKRTMFLYKAKTMIEGHMLRKDKWVEILEEYTEVASILKENVKKQFFLNIKFKINYEKRRYMNKLKQNSTQKQILGIIDLDKVEKGNVYTNKLK